MKIWLNLIIRTSSKGFTLLELLLASIMTFFVVSATGYAVLVMTQQSMVSDVASDTQSNLNRAMDFIADEAKAASSISTTATAATTAATDFALPTGATAVLGLNIAGVSQPIIYYVKPRADGEVWLGPNIIYRWGPTLSSSGAYTDQSTPSTWGVASPISGKRQGVALVDAIANSSYYTSGGTRIAYTGINEQGQKKCPAGGTAVATGWTAIPGIVFGTTYLGQTTGFFACVSNDGSQAEIHAYASLATELSNRGIADSSNADTRNTDRATYGVVSFVYPRSTSGVVAGGATGSSLTIVEPAKASLSVGTSCPSSLNVNINGATTSWTTANAFVPVTVYPSYSPVLSITTSGFTFTNTTTTDNIATFVNGGCTVTLTLNTP